MYTLTLTTIVDLLALCCEMSVLVLSCFCEYEISHLMNAINTTRNKAINHSNVDKNSRILENDFGY